jgi:hypothetical protein
MAYVFIDNRPFTYICLDEKSVIVDGGAADQNGKLLYTAVGKCGSLDVLLTRMINSSIKSLGLYSACE